MKQKWVLVTEETPSGEETVTVEVSETITGVVQEMATAEVSEAATAVQGKCTRSSVPIAVLRLKFLSDQLKEDQFTAEIAFQTTGNSEFNCSY